MTKGRAARMTARVKYISTRGGLADGADSKVTEAGDEASCRIIPFYAQDGVLMLNEYCGYTP